MLRVRPLAGVQRRRGDGPDRVQLGAAEREGSATLAQSEGQVQGPEARADEARRRTGDVALPGRVRRGAGGRGTTGWCRRARRQTVRPAVWHVQPDRRRRARGEGR